jgi:orotate phosphoribosyltransferase
VTTTGGSVMQAAEQVLHRGCTIVKIVSIIDRLEGAADTFARAGIVFESIYTWRDFN